MIPVEAVPDDSGNICYRQMCMKPARFRIDNRYLCYDHAVLAEWLPNVSKNPNTGPRGKKNQLKLPNLEATNATQSEGKEGHRSSETKPEGAGPAEHRGQVVSSAVESESAFVGTEQRPEAAPVQDDSHARPGDLQVRDVEGVGETGPDVGSKEQGAVGEGSAGAQGEAQESDPFDEDEGPEVYGEEEFGAEEDEGDPDAKGDAIRNGDFERGW